MGPWRQPCAVPSVYGVSTVAVPPIQKRLYMNKDIENIAGIRPAANTSDVDIHLGEKIRVLREQRQMSREALAREIEISPEELEEFERGVVRAKPVHLFLMGKVMGVDMQYFFEGFGDRPV